MFLGDLLESYETLLEESSDKLRSELIKICRKFPSLSDDSLLFIKNCCLSHDAKKCCTALNFLEVYLRYGETNFSALALMIADSTTCMAFVKIYLNTPSTMIQEQVLKVILTAHFVFKNKAEHNFYEVNYYYFFFFQTES